MDRVEYGVDADPDIASDNGIGTRMEQLVETQGRQARNNAKRTKLSADVRLLKLNNRSIFPIYHKLQHLPFHSILACAKFACVKRSNILCKLNGW